METASQKFHALAHEIGRISEASLDFLETRIIQRLPTNDRQRFRTYAYRHLAATTALGTARVIRPYLPIRRDTTGRVLSVSSHEPATRFLRLDPSLSHLPANSDEGPHASPTAQRQPPPPLPSESASPGTSALNGN